MEQAGGKVARRAFLGSAVAVVGAAACAPSAPAEAPGGAAGGGGGEPWRAEWDRLVAEAKKEGVISVFTLTGVGYRKALDAFGDAFGIQTEQQQEASASVWVPKIQKEREAGIYTFDVLVVPPNSALQRLKPLGAWDPIRPVIFRPDVLDDKAWREGTQAQYMDLEKQLAFAYEFTVNHAITIDTRQVKPDEIKGARDLLNPRWKGNMIFADARVGSTWLSMLNLRGSFPDGDELVRKLLVEQQPTFIRDARQRAEAIVRGKVPVVLGATYASLQEFQDQGLAGHVKHLDLPELDFIVNYSALLSNRAPHPNAAKLFINWLLTKEGQTIWCRNIPHNSARSDVEVFVPDAVATPGKKYLNSGSEATYSEQLETQRFIYGLLGITN